MLLKSKSTRMSELRLRLFDNAVVAIVLPTTIG
jgi:hypothetical protein